MLRKVKTPTVIVFLHQIFTAPTATLWARPGLGLGNRCEEVGLARSPGKSPGHVRSALWLLCPTGPASGLAECSGPTAAAPWPRCSYSRGKSVLLQAIEMGWFDMARMLKSRVPRAAMFLKGFLLIKMLGLILLP